MNTHKNDANFDERSHVTSLVKLQTITSYTRLFPNLHSFIRHKMKINDLNFKNIFVFLHAFIIYKTRKKTDKSTNPA